MRLSLCAGVFFQALRHVPANCEIRFCKPASILKALFNSIRLPVITFSGVSTAAATEDTFTQFTEYTGPFPFQ